MSYAQPCVAGGVPMITEKDAAIVLPPPSASNPVPTLPSALRLDNSEQLTALLETDPTGDSSMVSKRQLLVFADDSLRTLLMRQVLSDPSTRTYKGKKNWDPQHVFQLPRGMGIVGTRTLPVSSVTHLSHNPTVRTATETSHDAAEVSLLAESTSLDSIEDGVLPDNIDVVTYFIRPTPLAHTKNVAAKIRVWKSNHTHHRIVYMPQPTALCHKVLTNLGMTVSHSNISIHRLQLDVFPLESDVLSLELGDAVRETDVEGAPSTLITNAARALLKVQDVVGKIPRIQAVGPLGEEVVRKLMSFTLDEYMDSQEENVSLLNEASPDSSGDVSALVVMDRKVDMVTPMLTPLTFEGLLDDVIGIDCGFIQVDVNIINPPDEDTKLDGKQSEREIVALPAHGSDTLYAEVRDQHVEKFGQFLQNQAKALKESHAEFTNKGKKKDLNEIHQFVKQIPVFTQNLRSLTNHIHLAELVKRNTEETTFRERWQTERSMVEGELCYDMLEDLIASQYPPYRLLQLLCLQSLCGGGIKSSKYDQLRRDVVQTYGYEFLFVLHNLEKAGLLRRRETIWMDSASPFNSLRKSLILINAEVDTVDPDDVSYVSSGFAPLTARLIQTAIQGWNGKDEVLRELPGRLIDVTQKYPPEDLATAMKRSPGPSLGSVATSDVKRNKKPTMIVFFIGGVTFMEIAALRFLSRRQSFPYHIICLTTKVVNGKSLLQSLI